jgi:phosphoglycerate dehydrogenase-like enzyme
MGQETRIWVLMPDDFDRGRFFPADVAAGLNSLGSVLWNPGQAQVAQEELRERLPETDAVVTGWNSPRIGAEVLGGRHPGILLHAGGTVAPYVDETTFRLGIRVVSANEVFAQSVAEGTLAYMLAALRRIPYWSDRMKRGEWRGADFSNSGLIGKRVGLVSYGAITRRLIPLLQPFDTEIWLCSDHMSPEDCEKLQVKKASLEDIFAQCQVVSLHSALVDKTRHMVGRRLLSSMQDGALLVNTSRGAVIDEAALHDVLSQRDICAVLDVFETEPLPADSPLRRLDNAILVPHMGGPTMDRYPATGKLVVDELRRYLGGLPLLHEVTADQAAHMTAAG